MSHATISIHVGFHLVGRRKASPLESPDLGYGQPPLMPATWHIMEAIGHMLAALQS